MENLFLELSGPSCVDPINITVLCLYTDGLVSLYSLESCVYKLDKMNKKSVFVMNRLSEIQRLCEIHPVKFMFISGTQNHSDYITRCVSYKVLIETNYLCGLSETVPLEQNVQDLMCVVILIPNPNITCLSIQISQFEIILTADEIKTK